MAQDPRETFWALIEGSKVCMLSTIDGGLIRARPMKPYVDENAGEIRFITGLSSPKVEEIEDQQLAGLTFASGDEFVSVSGHVRVTQDRELLRSLWDGDAARFYSSPENPDVCVLIFVPTEAQYWDRSNRLEQAWQLLTSMVTRDPPPDLGEVRKIDF